MIIYKLGSDNYTIDDITSNEYQSLMNAIATSRGALEMNVDAFSRDIQKQLKTMLDKLIENE